MDRRIKIKIYPPPEAPTRKLKSVSKNGSKATAPEVKSEGPGDSGMNTEPVANNCNMKVELDPELNPQPDDNEEQDDLAGLNNQVLTGVQVEESKTPSHDQGQGTGRDPFSSVPNKDKKFKCVLCHDKSFNQVKHLNQHNKKVHKITWKATGAQIRANTCEKCGKVFQYPSTLLQHLWSHRDVNTEKCQICPNRTYKTLKSLKDHLKTAHVGTDLNAVDRAWCLSILDRQK